LQYIVNQNENSTSAYTVAKVQTGITRRQTHTTLTLVSDVRRNATPQDTGRLSSGA
jgi:hypothetical protein